MATLKGFVAFASRPESVGSTIVSALEVLGAKHGVTGLDTWKENDIAGRFLIEPILDQIENSDILVADITTLNFNVTFEIGYAIGCKKRVVLISNSAFAADTALRDQIGAFDTLGYQNYENSELLADFLANVTDLAGLSLDYPIERDTPIYVVFPPKQTDIEIRVESTVKKTRLGYRKFDPTEVGRMSAQEAISQVSRSLGVVVPFLANNRVDAPVHNIRAAFVAGLAQGMEKVPLFLQAGFDPVPLDHRDLVAVFNRVPEINEYVAEFAPQITEQLHSADDVPITKPASFLAGLTLGSSIAENEMRELGHYYIEKDEFRRAERGDVQIVVGRKGSGKTALFAQLRDRLRRHRNRIVLDLQPQGFQLLKFKDQVLRLMEEGTKEHTVAAFWEYLLLLEVAYKLLEKDRIPHTRNHQLFEPYRSLEARYATAEYTAQGDFAERMQWLVDAICERLGDHKVNPGELRLSSATLTELLYKHDINKLRDEVFAYLALKDGLWILVDNLDKGWPAAGLGADDLVMIRSLIDAINHLRLAVLKRDVACNGIVFVRNDVYELLVEYTSDRGKVAHVLIDWTDADELREMLRRRFVYNSLPDTTKFAEVWTKICISHVDGEESSQYLIDRCLMRPRGLIDLFNHCRSHAVNLGKAKIDATDIAHGEEMFSTDLVHNIGYELRDVFPKASDALYELIESPRRLSKAEAIAKFAKLGLSGDEVEELIKLLLWYGVLGLVRDADAITYIYDVKYDTKRLMALVGKVDTDKLRFEINPAFWRGLEVRT
jgi:hypothetical protein